MFSLFGKKNKNEKQETPVSRENQRKQESRPVQSADSRSDLSDQDLMMKITLMLHQNAGASFNLADVGLTDEEALEVGRAVHAFHQESLSELFGNSGFSYQNIENAKLALRYKTSVDATIYGVISNAAGFCTSIARPEGKQLLESALRKLAAYQPESQENKGVYYL